MSWQIPFWTFFGGYYANLQWASPEGKCGLTSSQLLWLCHPLSQGQGIEDAGLGTSEDGKWWSLPTGGVVLLRTGAGIQHPGHSAMVHKPQEANGSFQPRDIFFPEEKESLSLPALLREPVQGVLVHSGWAGVSKCKIHQKRATRLHTHEWCKVGYPRETQVKAREWGQSFSSFWSLILFKGSTLPQRKHVVWWKTSAWEAKRPRSWWPWQEAPWYILGKSRLLQP